MERNLGRLKAKGWWDPPLEKEDFVLAKCRQANLQGLGSVWSLSSDWTLLDKSCWWLRLACIVLQFPARIWCAYSRARRSNASSNVYVWWPGDPRVCRLANIYILEADDEVQFSISWERFLTNTEFQHHTKLQREYILSSLSRACSRDYWILSAYHLYTPRYCQLTAFNRTGACLSLSWMTSSGDLDLKIRDHTLQDFNRVISILTEP